jgi:hypothetical protein
MLAMTASAHREIVHSLKDRLAIRRVSGNRASEVVGHRLARAIRHDRANKNGPGIDDQLIIAAVAGARKINSISYRPPLIVSVFSTVFEKFLPLLELNDIPERSREIVPEEVL